jgi:hypothetical protein
MMKSNKRKRKKREKEKGGRSLIFPCVSVFELLGWGWGFNEISHHWQFDVVMHGTTYFFLLV